MSAILFIEGGASGAHSKELTIRCQRAFHRLLERMDLGIEGRKPKLKACGGRDRVFRDFRMEMQAEDHDFVAMWIDSEAPMVDIERTWKHLATVTTVPRWQQPEGAEDDQVLFMTTCMETWIVADREALRQHYRPKQSLNESPLPSPTDLEARQRHEVQKGLERATKDCSNGYAKGVRSFDVFEKLDPAVLKRHLPSFARVHRILKAKLT